MCSGWNVRWPGVAAVAVVAVEAAAVEAARVAEVDEVGLAEAESAAA